MTRLAGEQIGLGDRVQVLDMELRQEGRSFTSDTLRQLREEHPDDELWLLMGTDMFLTLQHWHEPEKILSLAGNRRLWADGGGHRRAVFRAAGLSLSHISTGSNFYYDDSWGDGHLVHRAAEQLAQKGGSKWLAPAVYGYILREHLYQTHVDLRHLPLSQLRPVALSYLKYKRIPPCAGD